jgi:hypothetical protein
VKDWGCITGKATRKQVDGVRAYGVLWPSLADLRQKFERKHGKQGEWSCQDKDWQDLAF